MQNDQQPSRYPELDALRGLAAMMVLFFHYTLGRPEADLGFKLGTTGVDLFFMISGFVIFMSLTKVKSSMEFVINRVSRLYPTYWVCVTFVFVLISAISVYKNGNFSHIDIGRYLGNLTMFQYYFGILDLDGPYWTMIIEMVFYIGMLSLFHFKLLRYLNIIGASLSLVVVFATYFFHDHDLVMKVLIWIPLLQFIPLFFAGTVFYKMRSSKRKVIQNYGLLALCLVCQISMFKYAGRSFKFINQGEYALMLIIYFSFFIMIVNNKLSFLISKITLFLGKISFSLYLIHQFVSIEVIIPFLVNKLHVNFWISSLFVSLPVVILLASFITYFLEAPLSKRMKEKLRSVLVDKSPAT